ncbi:MAG: hypothetical protein DWI24_08870 [Planctomycetota bacterium]|nr:MAG: hypothetical protein DWI24_08870 [Planctomycetota bacterium]
MAFFNGRVSFVRFAVEGITTEPFGTDAIDKLTLNAIGKYGTVESQDGIRVGFNGGRHLLDSEISFENNVFDESLHIGMRFDVDKIPSNILKAYTEIEIKALSAGNPSGRPTKEQKEEAKESALARALAESSDGRYRRMAVHPLLWDKSSQTLYSSAGSANVLDRVAPLFRDTFGGDLHLVTAGRLAAGLAARLGLTMPYGDPAKFTVFVEGQEEGAISWANPESLLPDVLGNEFLIWLWHTLATRSDTIALADGTEVTVMMTRTLQLDCPKGETGRDQLNDVGPARMPEALKALQSGKLPRKAGLILVRHQQQYELTLQAETFAVASAAMPKLEEASGREATLARIEQIRHMTDTLDLLYAAFLQSRLGENWGESVGEIRQWLKAA